jgi:hypothetical protein
MIQLYQLLCPGHLQVDRYSWNHDLSSCLWYLRYRKGKSIVNVTSTILSLTTRSSPLPFSSSLVLSDSVDDGLWSSDWH